MIFTKVEESVDVFSVIEILGGVLVVEGVFNALSFLEMLRESNIFYLRI